MDGIILLLFVLVARPPFILMESLGDLPQIIIITRTATQENFGLENSKQELIEQFNGYISNFRIVKGTAIYTADFSPTFTELTELPNTKLLALQSSSSATAYAVSPGAITAYGDATASSTSPGLISPNSVTGPLLEFDGVNDYLTVGSHADLAMGTGDFTIEMWVYSTDSSLDTQDRRFFASEANGTSAIQFGHINTTGGIVEYATNGSLGIRVTGTTDIRNR